MTDFDQGSDAGDCGDVSSNDAARYAFLAAVNHLPHIDTSWKPGLDFTHTIEAEIIPRLVLAHRNDGARRERQAISGAAITAEEIARFGDIILEDKLEEAIALTASLRDKGVPIETLMLDLLAPAAARLGEMWEEDDVDFMEVALAIQRLHQILRSLSGTLTPIFEPNKVAHRVLLATTPGESHIFSLLLVDQFFRGDGWDVWTMPGATEQELVELTSRESFAMIGLSVSCEELLPTLKRLIGNIRKTTANAMPAIMVGGPILSQRPGLSADLGADATARDGASAVIEGRRLVALASASRVPHL
ncbi:MAG: cobalamin-dependent protein [Beijerinckiaceae bacterium]|nr:cobalamin-dependent protein [Beijerinckiaceae bacterium]